MKSADGTPQNMNLPFKSHSEKYIQSFKTLKYPE